MLLLCTALPVCAFADDVHIATAYQPFMYFEKYNNGYWSDLGTPPHTVVETGQPAYCLQMSLESPYGDGYDATDGTQFYTPAILNGLKAILAHGYPASNGGFNDNQAQYATANAIRFFLAENGIQEMPYYLRDTGNSRPKPGYEDLFEWCLELLEYGRYPDTYHSIIFSKSNTTLEYENGSFIGDVRVGFTGLTGGYTLDTSSFPAGTSITGYTGSNGDMLHISIPEEYEELAFSLRASGVYDSTEAVLFFYAPTTYGQQRVVTCTIGMQCTTVDASMTVRTPKAPIRTGTIQLTKVDETGSPLPGVGFALYDNGNNIIQNGNTDTDGIISFEVPIGDYFYAETASLPHLVLDSTLHPVSVTEGGQLVSKTVVNEFARGNLKIVKRDAFEDMPLAGAGFRLYDSSGQQIAEGYTDANGELTFESLLYGSYSYQEFAPPKGYELDNTVYPFSITEHGVTVIQERDNLCRTGTLEVKKQDRNGVPLAGASYLLEYSTDNGSSWTPVASREGDNIISGGCTSPGLSDGQLTTGESGCVTFSGLRADSKILYRLTETNAPDGYALLGSPLYVGTLPVEITGTAEDTENVDGVTYCYTLYITATDDPIFRLPETGGAGFAWMPLVMGFMAMPYTILKRKDEIET